MLFNSLDFILFLPLVLLCYHFSPSRFRLYVLLIASYYFYMSWNPAYIILILGSTGIDYLAGRSLGETSGRNKRSLILAASLVFNLGLLAYFKYANFFIKNVSYLGSKYELDLLQWSTLDIILPVGISFYTFQTMSYTIDVYNRKIDPEKHLGIFALYVSFFPQLVAGPIERFSKIQGQFMVFKPVTSEQISIGAKYILYGFFMKMVIADNLGTTVDKAFERIEELHSLSLIAISFLYSFQIYCDFHGYSTIAIGVAALFGVRLSKNFKAPYFSHSLTDFWRNWHITLSTWFRDYIYYPMGGNKGGKLKWLVGILSVFIISGVWHGANWTFVVWGALHGLIIIVEKSLRLDSPNKSWIIRGFQVLITFSLVSGLFIIFRSPSLEFALQYFNAILHNSKGDFIPVPLELLVLLVGFICVDFYTRKNDLIKKLGSLSFGPRWIVYAVLVFLVLTRSGADVQPFIYFQF